MEGAQDMGGVPWSGPVMPEPDEPVFHAEWERRAFAITLAMGMPGGWNIDMSRFAREDRPPDEYLGMSYYQIWLAGLERLMLERGLIMADEIKAGAPLHPPKPVTRKLTSEGVAAMLHRGGPTEREAKSPALFAIGDRVRTGMIWKRAHPCTNRKDGAPINSQSRSRLAGVADKICANESRRRPVLVAEASACGV